MFELKKECGKDFVILNLADVQLSNEDWYPGSKNYEIAIRTIDTLIKRTDPDLITLSGDQGAPGHLESHLKLGSLIDGYNIPWTLVWGNHDQQNGYEFTDTVIERYFHLKNFVYEHGPAELGRGNFVIKISENDRPVSALIMMDTHDRMPFTHANGETKDAWAQLYPEQFTWYEQQIKALDELGYKDTVIISHIPIYAYKTAAERAFKSDINTNKISFLESLKGNVWNEGYESSFGVQYESISSYPTDDGFFNLIKRLGSTKHYLCGHDHINCTSIEHEGIRLTFALKTGAGCYWKPELNGGTVIRITENGPHAPEHEFVDVRHLL